MNIITLRDKLNQLIDQGKGEYIAIHDNEGVYEYNYVDEGFVYIENHQFGTDRSFISNEDLNGEDFTEEYRNELMEMSKKIAYRAIRIY
jgi:hypothetical protein